MPDDRAGCGIYTRTCQACGKSFVVMMPSMWVYKRTSSNGTLSQYFCSWTCYNKPKSTWVMKPKKVSPRKKVV